ncbi:MAG: TonB-dependent receptor [Gemmatimonadaceae bacterium]|nr:TonB-dependent receptor [Gemmatimonadaceae bacterium]
MVDTNTQPGTMPFRRFVIAAGLLFTVALIAPSPAHAQNADVIRGQVTGPDSLPIKSVRVTVTSISGNVNRTAVTDERGRFTVTFPGGDGDYMVSFAAIGFTAKRFEIRRVADEDVLVADARLTSAGTLLDAVQVSTSRDKVRRNDPTPDISGTEQRVDNTGVPADLLGDLAAMAASLPGVQGVTGSDGSDGFSVLGLGADQNNTTLNGMNFGGSNLPRDAGVISSLVTSPYDVSRGGFSGAQFNLRTRPGTNFLTRGVSLNFDSPHLQWSDRATQSLGHEYSNVSVGGALSGPLKFDKAFYNVSYQLGRRASDLQTLLNTDATGLQAEGVAADSVARLLGLLNTNGVPVSTKLVGNQRVADNGVIFGAFDFTPPSSTSGTALNFSFNGSWNKQNPAGGLPNEVPAHSGDRTSWRGGLQGRHSSYIHNSILSETSVSYSESKTLSTPYLDLPGGTVRVNSAFNDGTSGVQTLSFGGSQALRGNQTTNSLGFLNQLSWFSTNNQHRVKLTSELRRDGAGQQQATNLYGTYTYNSLADLQANLPSSFSRQLSPRVRDVSQLVGAVSLGDSYRRTSNLQFQYGVRVDGNKFLDNPVANPTLASAFKVANEFVPNKLYVSPRVGFSWTYGSGAQIEAFQGAFRAPRAVIRGGLGVFRNTPNSNLVASAMDNTGLPGAVQQITCVGTATPAANWAAFVQDATLIPTTCANGSTGSRFANAAPNVSLIAPDYSAPRSVRSNLSWGGATFGNRFAATVDGTLSLNYHQSGNTDLNFSGVPKFALPDESFRPVYVQPASIVGATGQIASQDARLVPSFSRVSELRSDLKSESKQLSFRLAPLKFNPTYSWSLSYVYSNVREQSRGFSSTVSNPLNVEWSRAAFDSRHQIVYNLSYNVADFVRVNWFGNFRSGLPFTPMTVGDVNGDGYSNDRAFVYKPASTNDAALAGAMQSLLANGSKEARSCLSKQLGQLAGRNSCQGPWSSTASMSFSFNPAKVRMPQRANLSFQLSNPLGAADMLLHGSNIRGWGQQVIPDPSLLYVRGFDPATQRFKYEVNQRFGAQNAAFGAQRSPVVLTAVMRFDIGPTRERQQLLQQLDRGRTRGGDKLPEGFLRAIYNSGGIQNPMATILRQQDSLRLTPTQADSIASMNRLFTVKNDAIWTPIVHYFVGLTDHYDRDVVYDKYIGGRKATIDLLIGIVPKVKGLLTPAQQRMLPSSVQSYLEPQYLASIRSGTATFTTGFFGADAFGGGGFGGGGGGGGGGERVIIRQ